MIFTFVDEWWVDQWPRDAKKNSIVKFVSSDNDTPHCDKQNEDKTQRKKTNIELVNVAENHPTDKITVIRKSWYLINDESPGQKSRSANNINFERFLGVRIFAQNAWNNETWVYGVFEIRGFLISRVMWCGARVRTFRGFLVMVEGWLVGV